MLDISDDIVGDEEGEIIVRCLHCSVAKYLLIIGKRCRVENTSHGRSAQTRVPELVSSNEQWISLVDYLTQIFQSQIINLQLTSSIQLPQCLNVKPNTFS